MEPDEKQAPDRYADVVDRLEAVVAQLEGGKLSLEESLEKFAEGVKLVERGEEILREAEKRIDLLLSKDGQTAPLEGGKLSEPVRPPRVTAGTRGASAPVRPAPTGDPESDVPF